MESFFLMILGSPSLKVREKSTSEDLPTNFRWFDILVGNTKAEEMHNWELRHSTIKI